MKALMTIDKRHQSRLLLACLIFLLLACLILTLVACVSLGVAVYCTIPRVLGQTPTATPPATPSPNPTLTPTPTPYPDPIIDQLNRQIDLIHKQVESDSAFSRRMLNFVGLLAGFVSVALALSIWRTRTYARDLLDEYFLDFKREELQPALEDAQDKLDRLSTQGTLIILRASHILLDETFRLTQETYRRQLESTGSTEEEIDTLLQDRTRAFRASKEVTQYLLASLSKDPMVVEDICQKLVALAGREAVRSRADFILEHMRGLMSSWPAGGSTRMEIRSLIDEIERRRRDGAGQ